ncbi:ornithine cyclodeaminase family protein [Niveispirillum sp. KHB5.9]|uniref:ornithine cyclodeaminase family protein n=1 Tax=Niveispirillum sp. KHB5.9 TaxID=3400269 RepID=UPI003A885933
MTDHRQPVLLSGGDIHALATPSDLVQALRTAFARGVTVPDRLHYTLPGDGRDMLLVMPAWREGGHTGVKIITYMAGNAEAGLPSINGSYLLLDGRTGIPAAIFDAAPLTLVRTAAVSALAASILSKPDSHRLLMVGTGSLAPHMVAAHMAVRPIRSVRLWGRVADKVQALARSLDHLGCEISVVTDLGRAVAEADIVSCATSSREPLIHGANVRPGTHVDMVGSFTPSMRETDDALVAAGILVVDSWTATTESGDVVTPLANGALARDRIALLEQVIRDPARGRRSADDITIFKSVGTGLSDLAAAELIHRRWQERQR